jgi:hypothetical protein
VGFPRLTAAQAWRALDVADALADEALHWTRTAGDDWEIAEAFRAKAIPAPSIAALRERVDAAATLLADVGNIHRLASLLTAAAYAGLCLGSARDAAAFTAPPDFYGPGSGQSVHTADQRGQSWPGRAADR